MKLIRKHGDIDTISENETIDISSLNHTVCRDLLTPTHDEVDELDDDDLKVSREEYDEDELSKYNLEKEFMNFFQNALDSYDKECS